MSEQVKPVATEEAPKNPWYIDFVNNLSVLVANKMELTGTQHQAIQSGLSQMTKELHGFKTGTLKLNENGIVEQVKPVDEQPKPKDKEPSKKVAAQT